MYQTVTNAVNKLKPKRAGRDGAAEIAAAIPAGWQMQMEPMAAKMNVQVVTVNGE